MIDALKQLNVQLAIFVGLVAVLFLMFHDWSSSEEKQTRALVTEWANKLDQKVTNTGAYIHWESDTLPVQDAWGNSLHVTYKNEGVAEQLIVRSAGKDKSLGSTDDIQITRTQLNMKGVGEGIKEHAAEVASEATKGATQNVKEFSKEAAKGAIQGLKESLKPTDGKNEP